MPPTASARLDVDADVIARHPAAQPPCPTAPSVPPVTPEHADGVPTRPDVELVAVPDLRSEDGSVVTEYGLISIAGATCIGLVLRWASGGAVFELFDGILSAVRDLAGF